MLSLWRMRSVSHALFGSHEAKLLTPDEDNQSDGSGHGSDESGPSNAPIPPTYYSMPLEKDLPVFSRLPKARNLALIFENA
ncbi:hypothetical protein FPRO04_05399 [Fusarium proliferatum]|nr:hypothetical protein FPRO04_05399 [Fusarium proliferatum]